MGGDDSWAIGTRQWSKTITRQGEMQSQTISLLKHNEIVSAFSQALGTLY
jgi:hypothetical protein